MAGFVRAIAPPVAHRSCGLASLPTVFTAWHGDYISALNTIRAVPAAA